MMASDLLSERGASRLRVPCREQEDLESHQNNGDRTGPCPELAASAHGNDLVDIDSLALGTEDLGGMVVQSAEMRKVLKTVARLGPYKATVLVYGESGTGKELVARAL